MSTPVSPLEQLEQQSSQAPPTQAQPSQQTAPSSNLSSLEQLEQQTQPRTNPAPRDVGTGVVPQSSIVDKVLGALAPQPVPQSKDAGLKQGDEGGYEGMLASGDQGKANFMSGAGGATLLTLLGSNYGPGALEAMKAAAESHPLVAKVLLHGLTNMGTLSLAKVFHVFNGK